MFIFLLPFLFVSISTASAQQTLKGYVVDAENSLPLVGVHVVTGIVGEGAITDQSGFFQIATSSKQLIFKYIGYDSVLLNVSNPTQILRIGLLPARQLLDQVVVTGNKSGSSLKELTISLERIPASLVSDKNPIQIDEILEQVPGVQITDGQVSIRGGSGWSYGAGSRVVVLVDGIPMLTGDAGQALWSFIPTENIDQIEVVKGASSVMYGSSALNGIINIRTKWAGSEPKTNVSVFGGGYSQPRNNTWQWSDVLQKTGGVRISDSRQVKNSDLVSHFEVLEDEGYRRGDYDKRIQGGLNYRYRISGNAFLGARANYFRNSSGSFLLWNSYDSAYLPLNGSNTENVGTRFNFDPFFTIQQKNGNEHRLKFRYFYVRNAVDNGNVNNDQSNSSKWYFGEYLLNKNWTFKTLSLLKMRSGLGVTGNFARTESPLFEGVQRASNGAVFAQIEPKIGPVKFEFGFRYEHFSLNDYTQQKPIFRTGMNIPLSRSSFAHVSYGEGFRFPTIAESYISTTVGPVTIYPNSALRAETGTNLEIGLTQGVKWKTAKGIVNLAWFDMRYNNMMEFTFGQWSGIRTPENNFGIGFKSINTGSVRITGFEYSQELTIPLFKGKLNWMGGLLFTNPVNLDPEKSWGVDSVNNPLNFLTTSSDTQGYILKYRSRQIYRSDLTYRIKKYELGVSMRYNSRFDNIDAAFENQLMSILIPGIRESRFANDPGDLIVDLRIFYQIRKNLRAGVIISNLFNEERYVRPGDMGPPRLSVFQLRMTFPDQEKKGTTPPQAN